MCVSYELFSAPTLKAETCAQVVEYPLTNKIVAFAEQWVEGNRVYDVFPKDVVDPPPPAPTHHPPAKLNPSIFKR
jgi:hypothetical protein